MKKGKEQGVIKRKKKKVYIPVSKSTREKVAAADRKTDDAVTFFFGVFGVYCVSVTGVPQTNHLVQTNFNVGDGNLIGTLVLTVSMVYLFFYLITK